MRKYTNFVNCSDLFEKTKTGSNVRSITHSRCKFSFTMVFQGRESPTLLLSCSFTELEA